MGVEKQKITELLNEAEELAKIIASILINADKKEKTGF
jgi:hypothetical protein